MTVEQAWALGVECLVLKRDGIARMPAEWRDRFEACFAEYMATAAAERFVVVHVADEAEAERVLHLVEEVTCSL